MPGSTLRTSDFILQEVAFEQGSADWTEKRKTTLDGEVPHPAAQI